MNNYNKKRKVTSLDCEVIFMPQNLSRTGIPNSYMIIMSKKEPDKPHQIRHYDHNGIVDLDIDCDDHNNDKEHYYPKHNGAHKHKWAPYREDQEELTDEEYEYYVLKYKELINATIKY